MNPHDIYFKSIEDNLIHLTMSVYINGKLNLLDGNIFSESFFARFMNILWGMNFRDTNNFVSNYSAIDLIDEKNKILCQVTSNTSTDKVKKTIEKADVDRYKNYNLKFIFITKDASKLRTKKYADTKLIRFTKENDILDITRLLADCRDSEGTTLLKLMNLCNVEIGHGTVVNVETSAMVKLLQAINSAKIDPVTAINFPRPFNIQSKIDFNKLNILQRGTIDEMQVFSSALDDIYRTFSQEGITTTTIFQKLIALYQNQIVKFPEKNQATMFLDMVDDLLKYTNKNDGISDLTLEQREYYCRVILVDAFIRCKIFEDPEGYHYDFAE